MDIPLSNFKGDYVKALTAMKMNVEDEQLIKFWFSVEDGLLGMTTTKSFTKDQLSFRKFNHEEDWMKTASDIQVKKYVNRTFDGGWIGFLNSL